jgi:hypothetical protein
MTTQQLGVVFHPGMRPPISMKARIPLASGGYLDISIQEYLNDGKD